MFWNFSINKVTLINYPIFSNTSAIWISSIKDKHNDKPHRRALWYFKELFCKEYRTVNFENIIQFWRISKNVWRFQYYNFKNFYWKVCYDVCYCNVIYILSLKVHEKVKNENCVINLFWKKDTRTTFSLIELKFLKYCWLPRKFM